ncbi:sensor histidine kinase [Leptospira vanthielii]|uniref:histidine kinase n=1 Tax=Leptospira vanthielii serovar Holland str. Waz Holland = ATCC 700522 TaxID=1218591 RepID=N1VXL1_9LEPT|nr:HAMP domain-containing sensor histidine kinase [Leptospira vanthielii]EMY68714.1 histidine kinase A domain protein [Leptospira vanthielii serovar Holland str. Waz Holland = ATCC 700522]
MAIYKSQVQKHIRNVESRLAENQKWETIALVASGISHEINNPLTSILNLADLISLEAKKLANPSLGEKASKIAEESERIAKIIKNLVSYSQSTSSQWNYSNLGSILNDTRSFLHQYFLKEGIQCEIEIGDVPLAYCQPQKIKQVLLNLIQDARVRVNTREDTTGRKITIILKQAEDDGSSHILIQIKDNGAEDLMKGISQMNSLEVSKSIVTEHKGKMYRDEESSSWFFTLPIIKPL